MSGSRVSLIFLPHCAAPPPLTRAARGARLFQDVDSPPLPRPVLVCSYPDKELMQYSDRLSVVRPIRSREQGFLILYFFFFLSPRCLIRPLLTYKPRLPSCVLLKSSTDFTEKNKINFFSPLPPSLINLGFMRKGGH